ncbi:MAG: ferrous iron transport protein A [Cyanobacteria bacterium SID2]|nr:ferrous iron transport protein A [Cyanobacteria bacterium SID2]MBP0004812.1 ferrous iron transport protein A [Cyanobacteria bacterium SBC]
MNRYPTDRECCGERPRRGWKFTFLGDVNEENGSIEASSVPAPLDGFALSEASVGDRLWIVSLTRQCGFKRLHGMGLARGVELQVLSKMPSGSVVVAVRDERLGLNAGIASQTFVSKSKPKMSPMDTSTRKSLKDFATGAKGKVLGYESATGSYKRKLLAMGLTPGTEFTVNRHAPLGDPVEICVRGFSLSLRKAEAESLVVEEV